MTKTNGHKQDSRGRTPKQPAPPLPLPEPPEPPPASLYSRHALALANVTQFLVGHWLSYTNLIPERFLDGVAEPQIAASLRHAAEQMIEYAGRAAVWHELTDELYRREHRDNLQLQEHEAVEDLNALVQMHLASERRKDAMDVPALLAEGIPPDVPSAPDRTLRQRWPRYSASTSLRRIWPSSRSARSRSRMRTAA